MKVSIQPCRFLQQELHRLSPTKASLLPTPYLHTRAHSAQCVASRCTVWLSIYMYLCMQSVWAAQSGSCKVYISLEQLFKVNEHFPCWMREPACIQNKVCLWTFLNMWLSISRYKSNQNNHSSCVKNLPKGKETYLLNCLLVSQAETNKLKAKQHKTQR